MDQEFLECVGYFNMVDGGEGDDFVVDGGGVWFMMEEEQDE